MSVKIDTPEVIPIINTIGSITKDGPNKYHDVECCDWTRGIDNLLFRYKQDRDEITSLVESNPDKLIRTIWKQEGPLAVDNDCRCQMGNGDIRSPFSCAQCKNLRKLLDFRLGGIERPFQLECGNYAGKSLIVSSTDIAAPFLTWDEESCRRARNYIQQYHNLTMCGTPSMRDMRCITGDSFTIRTIILWMISKIFSIKGLPHIPLMHTAFICRGTGYSLYDMPSIGTLSELHKIEAYHDLDSNSKKESTVKSQHFAYAPLKSSIARSIIMQLLIILLELTNINFSHGTPSIHGLIFNKDPVSYRYDGVPIQSPITLQLSDLWNSSATFESIHYFPKNVGSSMYLERGMFVPDISTKTISMAHCYDVGAIDNGGTQIACPATITTCPDANTYEVCKGKNVVVYRLTNSTVDIYNSMRHIGFPLYTGSFDFYCFMVSLMCDKSFFDAVTKDAKLYRLWSMMWLIEDLPNIERLIKQTHDIESKGETPTSNRAASNTVISIIRGAWLRCDVVKFLWSLIKLGW